MKQRYHQIEPDHYADYGITQNPRLPDGVSFIEGLKISTRLPTPLKFETNYPAGSVLPHLLGDRIPVFSTTLIRVLKEAGADNLQVFPAVIKNPETGTSWKGFSAVNVLGLFPCAHRKLSDYDTLMRGHTKASISPLLAFNTLILDKNKLPKALLFRLAESPSTLLIHESVNRYLDAHDPPEGWNFDAIEIEVR